MRDINLTNISEVRYGREPTFKKDGFNTVAKHLCSRWGASFFPYRMRKGEPSFLFLDGEGVIVSFASLHWDILAVNSVCFLRNSFVSMFMVRVGG